MFLDFGTLFSEQRRINLGRRALVMLDIHYSTSTPASIKSRQMANFGVILGKIRYCAINTRIWGDFFSSVVTVVRFRRNFDVFSHFFAIFSRLALVNLNCAFALAKRVSCRKQVKIITAAERQSDSASNTTDFSPFYILRARWVKMGHLSGYSWFKKGRIIYEISLLVLRLVGRMHFLSGASCVLKCTLIVWIPIFVAHSRKTAVGAST